MKVPEGVVKEVLGGEDRGYYLPEGRSEKLESHIGWANINDKAEVEAEVLNWVFVVPYPYVKAVEVSARPHLRKETLEATEVVGFGCESDGRESGQGVRSEVGGGFIGYVRRGPPAS